MYRFIRGFYKFSFEKFVERRIKNIQAIDNLKIHQISKNLMKVLQLDQTINIRNQILIQKFQQAVLVQLIPLKNILKLYMIHNKYTIVVTSGFDQDLITIVFDHLGKVVGSRRLYGYQDLQVLELFEEQYFLRLIQDLRHGLKKGVEISFKNLNTIIKALQNLSFYQQSLLNQIFDKIQRKITNNDKQYRCLEGEIYRPFQFNIHEPIQGLEETLKTELKMIIQPYLVNIEQNQANIVFNKFKSFVDAIIKVKLDYKKLVSLSNNPRFFLYANINKDLLQLEQNLVELGLVKPIKQQEVEKSQYSNIVEEVIQTIKIYFPFKQQFYNILSLFEQQQYNFLNSDKYYLSKCLVSLSLLAISSSKQYANKDFINYKWAKQFNHKIQSVDKIFTNCFSIIYRSFPRIMKIDENDNYEAIVDKTLSLVNIGKHQQAQRYFEILYKKQIRNQNLDTLINLLYVSIDLNRQLNYFPIIDIVESLKSNIYMSPKTIISLFNYFQKHKIFKNQFKWLCNRILHQSSQSFQDIVYYISQFKKEKLELKDVSIFQTKNYTGLIKFIQRIRNIKNPLVNIVETFFQNKFSMIENQIFIKQNSSIDSPYICILPSNYSSLQGKISGNAIYLFNRLSSIFKKQINLLPITRILQIDYQKNNIILKRKDVFNQTINNLYKCSYIQKVRQMFKQVMDFVNTQKQRQYITNRIRDILNYIPPKNNFEIQKLKFKLHLMQRQLSGIPNSQQLCKQLIQLNKQIKCEKIPKQISIKNQNSWVGKNLLLEQIGSPKRYNKTLQFINMQYLYYNKFQNYLTDQLKNKIGKNNCYTIETNSLLSKLINMNFLRIKTFNIYPFKKLRKQKYFFQHFVFWQKIMYESSQQLKKQMEYYNSLRQNKQILLTNQQKKILTLAKFRYKLKRMNPQNLMNLLNLELWSIIISQKQQNHFKTNTNFPRLTLLPKEQVPSLSSFSPYLNLIKEMESQLVVASQKHRKLLQILRMDYENGFLSFEKFKQIKSTLDKKVIEVGNRNQGIQDQMIILSSTIGKRYDVKIESKLIEEYRTESFIQGDTEQKYLNMISQYSQKIMIRLYLLNKIIEKKQFNDSQMKYIKKWNNQLNHIFKKQIKQISVNFSIKNLSSHDISILKQYGLYSTQLQQLNISQIIIQFANIFNESLIQKFQLLLQLPLLQKQLNIQKFYFNISSSKALIHLHLQLQQAQIDNIQIQRDKLQQLTKYLKDKSKISQLNYKRQYKNINKVIQREFRKEIIGQYLARKQQQFNKEFEPKLFLEKNDKQNLQNFQKIFQIPYSQCSQQDLDNIIENIAQRLYLIKYSRPVYFKGLVKLIIMHHRVKKQSLQVLIALLQLFKIQIKFNSCQIQQLMNIHKPYPKRSIQQIIKELKEYDSHFFENLIHQFKQVVKQNKLI